MLHLQDNHSAFDTHPTNSSRSSRLQTTTLSRCAGRSSVMSHHPSSNPTSQTTPTACDRTPWSAPQILEGRFRLSGVMVPLPVHGKDSVRKKVEALKSCLGQQLGTDTFHRYVLGGHGHAQSHSITFQTSLAQHSRRTRLLLRHCRS